jgi:methyl-accepting chemotaxis protein-1 (serine sensor receptor)
MLKNLTIKARLIFVLGVLSIQLVLGAVMGLTALTKAQDSMQSIYDHRLVSLGRLDTVMRQSIRSEAIVALAATAPSDKVAEYLETIATDNAALHKAWADYLTANPDDAEKELANDFITKRKKFEQDALEPTVAAIRAGNSAQAVNLLHEKVVPLFRVLKEPGNKVVNLQLAEAAKEQKEAADRYVLVRNLCLAGLAVGLALAVGVGAWLIRAIVAPLNQAADVARKVAAGDLSTRIDTSSNDETGQVLRALQAMTTSLTTIVQGVRAGTDTMSTASREIAAGNQDLSSRTEQQAASLEETASSMEELTSTVRQTAESARQGNQLAIAATDTAKKGGAAMEQVVQTMENINQSAHRIAEITSVIDGIAFQTNILALNAAVEAARAGEAGRGFAVVATEVRALAQRCTQAAKEIKALIDASSHQTAQGTQQVHQAGDTMRDILQSISQVNDIMAEISAASREQSGGIEQVNLAITQMDQVTQQNAALVEEAAAAASSMQQEAERLAQAVAVFKTA